MKAKIFLSTILFALAFTVSAQTYIPLTCYKSGGSGPLKDSVKSINVKNIGQYYTSGSETIVTVNDFQLRSSVDYSVRQITDSITGRGNKTEANFIPLHKCQKVGTTDSFITVYFNIDNLSSVDGVTVGKTYSHGKVFYKNGADGSTPVPTVETSARFTAIVDSCKLINSLPYKIYSATLSQASTAAPVVQSTGVGGANTPWHNSIGAIVWARSSSGVYTGTLTGAFVSGKTEILPTVSVTQADASTVTIVRTSADVITITASADSKLSNFPIEIRVYK